MRYDYAGLSRLYFVRSFVEQEGQLIAKFMGHQISIDISNNFKKYLPIRMCCDYISNSDDGSEINKYV